MAEEKDDILKRILQEHADMRKKVKDSRYAEAQRRLEADLRAIRRIDPEIKEVEDLDEEFFELIRNGFDGVTAFMALKAKKENGKRSTPPAVGRVAKVSDAEKDYFTARELNLLSSRELDDPKVLKKALRSMVKSKKH
ncbi:MAG: hypothetical protein E7235_05610 [Lachnospiraceae bacterium]|nr:hypothetical protein [Lachnospiraceae bacterium]